MVISALSALRGTSDMAEELQSKTQQNELLEWTVIETGKITN